MDDDSAHGSPAGAAITVVREYESGFNAGDADALATLYAPDVVFVNLAGELFAGRDAVRAQQAAGFDDALARVTITLAVEELRELGDRHVLVVTRQIAISAAGPDERPASSTAFFGLVLVRGVDGWRIQSCQNTPSR